MTKCELVKINPSFHEPHIRSHVAFKYCRVQSVYTQETISTANCALTKSNAHLQCFLEQSDDVGVNSGRRLEAEGKGKGEGESFRNQKSVHKHRCFYFSSCARIYPIQLGWFLKHLSVCMFLCSNFSSLVQTNEFSPKHN